MIARVYSFFRVLIYPLLFLIVLTISYTQRSQSLYWEEPVIILESGARFPNAVSGGELTAVVWQEYIPSGREKGDVYLSIQTSMNVKDAKAWQVNRRFAGPYPAQQREAPIFSLAMNKQGRIFLAIAQAENSTQVLSSSDNGQSFQSLNILKAVYSGESLTTLAPNILLTDSGNLLLFLTQQSGNFLAIHYAVSRDGVNWSNFKPLVKDEDLLINFLPHHTSLYGREYVVFQGLPSGPRQNYQLYMKISSDGGNTWGQAISISFNELIDGKLQELSQFINQRPFIAALNGKIGLTWERQFGGRPPRIYYGELDTSGKLIGVPEPITEGSSAHFPQIIRIKNQTYLFWFDNRRGDDHIFVAEKTELGWYNIKDLSNLEGISRFARPVRLDDNLYLFWENQVAGTSKLIFLQPDQTVIMPSLQAVGFDPKRESKQDSVLIRWTVPYDPSGIDVLSYVWSQNPQASPEMGITVLPDRTSVKLQADKDGTWYFRLAALDYALNWSEPATISFTRDTTPPGSVEIIWPDTDPDGFLISNTFEISWHPPADGEAAGYSYSLKFLGSKKKGPETAEIHPVPRRIMATDPFESFNNQDNGYWALSVAAIDRAGNVGKADIIFLELNKYIPVTYITYVDAKRDPTGSVNLRILGRGFSKGGLVSQVILDRDGMQPFDYSFGLKDGFFRVNSDRVIADLNLVDFEQGLYRVGLNHPLRGLYFTTPLLKLEPQGTIKFGNFSISYKEPWKKVNRASLFFSVNDLVIWLIVFFLFFLVLISIKKMASLVREGQVLRGEILAVIQGKAPVFIKEKRMKELKRQGLGLRLKFTMLTTVLVILIVLIVSIPLSVFMIDTQRNIQAEGLFQRGEVILGSLASGAATNLPRGDAGRIDLGLLPRQISAMEEAEFATIAGLRADDPDNFDYVWATNDPEISNKIGGQNYRQGEVRIEDEISPMAISLEKQINSQAREALATLAPEIDKLSVEARQLARQLAVTPNQDLSQRLIEIQDAIRALNIRISDELQGIGTETGSFPEFDPQELLPFYTFYRPIVYRSPRDDLYFRGIVRMEVSTAKIIGEITSSRWTLIKWTGIIALIATGLGLLGAIIMASITLTPIKKLAAGVAVIRDTEDKEKLKDHTIDVRSKDEIGVLATTVNQMTQGLVEAAKANKDLIMGKEVQKMFIPLEKDSSGKKGSTGGEQNENIEIYGYYEGAKGVSGDYFDYIKLADKYYATIKCDVAGKGVPAALIMVEVSTIFSTFFRNWTLKSPGLKIDGLVYQINDMLEERGFKGRFAALTLCIINSETGKSYFCNAGDTHLHTYKNDQSKMVELKLPEAPAAGVFPSMLVETQEGFKQVGLQLNAGDTLFLFTDGVEEARRTFRNEEFKVISCDEPGLKENEEHGGTHKKGDDYEELGIPRIYEIINAVLNKTEYKLVKYHNPIHEEDLTFDFTRCRGSVQDAVLAMAAVEKVFRICPDPNASEEDQVVMDKSIDRFLSEYFEQYGSYFRHRLEGKEEDSAVTFINIKEDEQYDDLTILAIRKK